MPMLEQNYTLYALHGRIYAENAVGKLIDIGSIRKEGNAYQCRLDAEGAVSDTMESPERALADLQQHIDLLFMDGQFTALPDSRPHTRLPHDTPRASITLTGEVHDPVRGGDTPHIF